LLAQLLTFLLIGAGGGLAASQAGLDEVVVRTVRFYRTGHTIVNGFVRVPHRLLDGVVIGPSGFAAYGLEVTVTDSQGMTLTHEQWSRRVPWTVSQVRGSASMEALTFALSAGAYTLHVEVRDSATGRRQAATLPLTAFDARPVASDLLLGSAIRRTAPGDTSAQVGEIAKGDLRIATGPAIVLTPTRAALAYYCEVYGDSAAQVPWRLEVRGASGRAMVSTAATVAAIGAGGGILDGTLDLAGLPPGDYTLRLVIGTSPDTVSRVAGFTMAGFDVEQQLATLREEPRDRFSGLDEARLDSLSAPLVYLAEGGELDLYSGLTVEGKRRFLRDFWRRRDSTAVSPGAFYARIAEANRRFREGGAAEIPGWRTDRGRIFILHGEPDDMLRRPSTGSAPPWEAWKYTRTRPLKYVFLDQAIGNYNLIYTNDIRERSFPNWDSILGPDAVRDIQNF
jgi:GWxTD domain-containing protein